MALYLFNILTGLGDMTSVCLNAHLLIDKLQLYRYQHLSYQRWHVPACITCFVCTRELHVLLLHTCRSTTA